MREIGYGSVDQSADVLGIVSGAPFLRSSGIRSNLSVTHERLTCVDHMRYVWSGIIHGLSMRCVWRVGRIFPCRVYINSNHRDSRIWVSLICDSHHVDNLTDLMSLSTIDVCCLIQLIVATLVWVEYDALLFEMFWIEWKLESKESLLARVCHSIELFT
jgi:hypothetical protein